MWIHYCLSKVRALLWLGQDFLINRYYLAMETWLQLQEVTANKH